MTDFLNIRFYQNEKTDSKSFSLAAILRSIGKMDNGRLSYLDTSIWAKLCVTRVWFFFVTFFFSFTFSEKHKRVCIFVMPAANFPIRK